MPETPADLNVVKSPMKKAKKNKKEKKEVTTLSESLVSIKVKLRVTYVQLKHF